MIECYYKGCKHHCKDEPLCKLISCQATAKQIAEYSEKHQEELKK